LISDGQSKHRDTVWIFDLTRFQTTHQNIHWYLQSTSAW